MGSGKWSGGAYLLRYPYAWADPSHGITTNNEQKYNNNSNNLPIYIIFSMSDLHPWCESHSGSLQSPTEADETVEHQLCFL
jgi:hypothetical protein